MRTIKSILFLIALLALSCCKPNKNEYDATGTFEATEIIVSAEGSGKLLLFSIEEGEKLNANQQVGYIDTVQLYLKKRQLLSSVKSVQSRRSDISKQIAATKQQITTAKTEKERAENLIKLNAGNKKQLDDINAQIAVLEKQLTAQISTLQNSNNSVTEESSALEIQVAQLEDQLQKCCITTPIAGTILTKYAQQGELATPGKPLFKMADTENMFLRAYITSDQLAEIKIGQEVSVFADYGDNLRKEYPGKITWISDKAEFTPKTIQTKNERANLVYAIKVALKNDGEVKIGMYGEMKKR